jgi:hypothetical protein
MTDVPAVPQPESEPGIASAEEGMVMLDGPSGVAVTMTAAAAEQTGQNLIAAARIAERQSGLASKAEEI